MALENQLKRDSRDTSVINTKYRRIETRIPCPEDEERIRSCVDAVPAVNGYQTAVIWEKAYGATVEDITLMRRIVGPEMGVKASGGVRSLDDARAMMAAGATRLGASASVKIVQGGVASGSY